MICFNIVNHVAERWLKRVDDTLSPAEAGAEIQAFLLNAKLQEEPPDWMRRGGLRGGHELFAVNPEQPDVVLVVRGNRIPLRVTTVVTRAVADAWRARWRPEQLQPAAKNVLADLHEQLSPLPGELDVDAEEITY